MFHYTQTTTSELKDGGVDTVVISCGATEQCGPYLPFHIDILVAEFFASHWGEVLNAYVLPTLPFNTSEEHSAFRGTVSVSPTVMFALLEEVVSCMRKQGFHKQVLTGGHGGAYWCGAFVKHINHKYDDTILIDTHTSASPNWEKALERADIAGRNEIHGGMVSKCVASFLCPDSVRSGAYGSEIDAKLNAYIDYGVWHKIARDGSWGVLRESEAHDDLSEKGRLLLEAFVELQGEFLVKHVAEACRLKGIG
jgi:creatinine amidohydrolase